MDPVQQFQALTRDLVTAQRELAGLYRQAADPLFEAQTASRRAELITRRDAMMDAWARLGLAWLLHGGEVHLSADQPTTGEGDGGETREEDESARPVAVIRPPEPGPEVVRVDGPTMDRGFSTSTWARSPLTRPIPLDVERLKELLVTAETPPDHIADMSGVLEELRRLSEITTPASLAVWSDFPKDVQRALVGMTVARARHVQDEIPTSLHPMNIDQELDRFFSSMTAFSKREQPGFVFGLRRHHHAVAENWFADAHRWWSELVARVPETAVLNPERALEELRTALEEGSSDDDMIALALTALDAGLAPEDQRLVRLMMPHQDKLGKHTRFKRLRKAIRDTQTEDKAIEAEVGQDDTTIPADWPYHSALKGKRALILGGEPHEDARKRLQDALGLASLEWVNAEDVKNIQQAASAIRGGTADLAIILRRFIGHNVDRTIIPACRTAGVLWVSVERGYGVAQIKAAVEQFLGAT